MAFAFWSFRLCLLRAEVGRYGVLSIVLVFDTGTWYFFIAYTEYYYYYFFGRSRIVEDWDMLGCTTGSVRAHASIYL